ncbi:hypothetical protein GOM49_15200 [Clostridium bovifaecis]|uniref:Uncharacterized protein n=1 Tax=Clostridium bovifaecis TaxID=2184719 RepID=A0A6I6ER91_9CLOT|nr:hypothetical protein GOM49_15200 [Clostridium bovifaecis]
MIISVIILKVNVGLCATLLSTLLILLGANEKKAIANMPCGLVMLSGVSVLINVVIQLGGIDLLAKGLAKLMTENTAPIILSMAAGLL